MLSIVGFGIITAILVTVMTKKLSPLVALSVIPAIGAIVVGEIANLNGYVVTGIGKVAMTGIMFVFSTIFFGLISDTGAFDPLVNKIIKFTKGDPIKVMIGTFLFAILGHLDGSGVTTVLLVAPPMIPIYDKLKMNRFTLAISLGLGAGIMNIVPWGGPTMRAATALNMDVMELWKPVIPTQILGLISALLLIIWIGRKEKNRLIEEGIFVKGDAEDFSYKITLTEEQQMLRRPKRVAINLILVVLVLTVLVKGYLAPAPTFMFGLVIAMLLNYRDAEVQKSIIDVHGKNGVMLSSVIFASGVLMGVLNGTGMSGAMVETMVSIVPKTLGGFMAPIVGFLSVPLSLLFDADSYYYGIMPVLAETVQHYGIPAVDIARASIMGQITVGWPVTPMVATFFLFTGVCGVDIGEWQRYAFKYFWAISAIMTLGLIVFRVFSF